MSLLLGPEKSQKYKTRNSSPRITWKHITLSSVLYIVKFLRLCNNQTSITLLFFPICILPFQVSFVTKLVKKNHSAKDCKIYLPFYCQISSELSFESSIMKQKFREMTDQFPLRRAKACCYQLCRS